MQLEVEIITRMNLLRLIFIKRGKVLLNQILINKNTVLETQKSYNKLTKKKAPRTEEDYSGEFSQMFREQLFSDI